MNYNLAKPFYESARKHPGKIAIWVDGQGFSYEELLSKVVHIASLLCRGGEAPKRVGILASRGLESYVGILASAWIGAAYLPIEPALPESALIGILNRSGLDALIADAAGSKTLSERVLEVCPPKVLALRRHLPSPNSSRTTDFDEPAPTGCPKEPVLMEIDEPGYLLYTSGSTGVPKAVVIPVGGVEHLLRTTDILYPIREDDRAAGNSPVTFDYSVYDMFSAWAVGATLYVVPVNQAIAPAGFIRDHKITTWTSAPSIAAQMARMGLLKPNSLPSLRRTLFSGEALPISVAKAWQDASPSSKVCNIFGATEVTVIFMGQDYEPGCPVTGDCVAIGKPFPGTGAAIATPELEIAVDGVTGELLISGPQLALGYLDDEEKTRLRFVQINGERWYRTGDHAYKDSNGVFHYMGRIDHQVKLLGGFRVELGEIETHLRQVTGCESVAAVAWPQQGGSALGIVAFLGGYTGPTSQIRSAMLERLPNYMAPTQIHVLPELPLNTNGKVDRKQLIALLNERTGEPK